MCVYIYIYIYMYAGAELRRATPGDQLRAEVSPGLRGSEQIAYYVYSMCIYIYIHMVVIITVYIVYNVQGAEQIV